MTAVCSTWQLNKGFCVLLEYSLFSNNKDSRSHDGIFSIHFLVLANTVLVHHSQKKSIRNGNKSTGYTQ